MFKKIICLTLMLVVMASMGVSFAMETGVKDVDEEVLAGLQPSNTRSITWIVTNDGVRLRDEPSTSGTILGLLYSGDMVNEGSDERVNADGYEWACVYSYNHSCWGWVAANYLEE